MESLLRGLQYILMCDRPPMPALELLKLRDAVNEITSRDRRVLELRFRDGRTLEDVARMFGVSKARIHQVERKLLDRIARAVPAQPGKES